MYVTKKMCPHLKIVSVLQLSHIFSKGAAEIFFFFPQTQEGGECVRE